VALYSLMMDAADPAHAGTDYTLLASAGVAVGSLGSVVGGMVGDAFGYVPAFVLGTVLSALGVLALVFWLDRHPVNARVSQAWRRVV
jgi:PAT family beta-lactamase induction signal transducer AmpG